MHILTFLMFLFPDPSFRVGVVIDIKLDIRPRKTSGVLLSVHGRRDFLLLQMVNGVLKFSVDNGKGAISAQYTPPHEHYFCDGNWHTIQGMKTCIYKMTPSLPNKCSTLIYILDYFSHFLPYLA